MDNEDRRNIYLAAKEMDRRGQVKGVEVSITGKVCTLGAVRKTARGHRGTWKTMRALDQVTQRRWNCDAITANDAGRLKVKHLYEFAGTQGEGVRRQEAAAATKAQKAQAKQQARQRSRTGPSSKATKSGLGPCVISVVGTKKKSGKPEGDAVCCGGMESLAGGRSKTSAVGIGAAVAAVAVIGAVVTFHAAIGVALTVLAATVLTVMAVVAVTYGGALSNVGLERATARARAKLAADLEASLGERRTALPAAEPVVVPQARVEPLALPAAAPVRVSSVRVSSPEGLRAADLAEERRAADARREPVKIRQESV